MAAYLDHIGIAVGENSPLAKVFAILGLPITTEEIVEREQVRTEWIPLPVKQGNLELLHPTQDGSTIDKFLAKTGRDAVHHLSFRVDSMATVTQALQAQGFRLVYDGARAGAHGCMVNFIHPATTGGVLIEITEKQ